MRGPDSAAGFFLGRRAFRSASWAPSSRLVGPPPRVHFRRRSWAHTQLRAAHWCSVDIRTYWAAGMSVTRAEEAGVCCMARYRMARWVAEARRDWRNVTDRWRASCRIGVGPPSEVRRAESASRGGSIRNAQDCSHRSYRPDRSCPPRRSPTALRIVDGALHPPHGSCMRRSLHRRQEGLSAPTWPATDPATAGSFTWGLRLVASPTPPARLTRSAVTEQKARAR